MTVAVPARFKWAYCLALLFAALPLGLAGSSWVGLARGGPVGALLLLGSLPLLVLALYRIYLVVRDPGTLNSQPAAGVNRVLRALGVVAIYLGAVVAIASVTAGPLMHIFMRSHTASGIEYFAVGLFLSQLGEVGKVGLLCYELSRLVAFERHAAPAREQ